MVSTRKMLTEHFIAMQDNPIQRDTEKHAAKAKHLRTPHPTHSVVHAAELPTGKLIKLDGHTRALLWRRKEIPIPMQVTVLVYPVKDKEEAEQLYKDFDSKDALETQRDKVYGAFNRHHFDPQSGLLQGGNLTYALRMATGILLGLTAKSASGGGSVDGSRGKKVQGAQKADVYSMVNEWTYEMHALDGFGLGQGQASAGVVAAFLVSYRKYGHKLTPFWRGVFAGTGTKANGQMDGIQALCEAIMQRRGKSFGGQATADTCARALQAVEKWLNDEMLSTIPRPLDTTAYLSGFEKPTERLIKRDDIGKRKAG